MGLKVGLSSQLSCTDMVVESDLRPGRISPCNEHLTLSGCLGRSLNGYGQVRDVIDTDISLLWRGVGKYNTAILLSNVIRYPLKDKQI